MHALENLGLWLSLFLSNLSDVAVELIPTGINFKPFLSSNQRKRRKAKKNNNKGVKEGGGENVVRRVPLDAADTNFLKAFETKIRVLCATRWKTGAQEGSRKTGVWGGVYSRRHDLCRTTLAKYTSIEKKASGEYHPSESMEWTLLVSEKKPSIITFSLWLTNNCEIGF